MTKRLIPLLLIGLPLCLGGCAFDKLLSQMGNVPPEAVIDASPLQGPCPLEVTLDARYSRDDVAIAECVWDLGDPQQPGLENGEAVEHTYALPGTYLVKLTVRDDEGAIDTEKVAIEVGNPAPNPRVSVSDSEPRPGTRVRFDASKSTDANGVIVGYSWDFDDDGATANGVEVTHTFTVEGTYNVVLTVIDDTGGVATETVKLVVEERGGDSDCDDGSCGEPGDSPLALIIIPGITSCQGGQVGEPILFDGSWSRAAEDDDRLVHFYWEFDDGETSNEVKPVHTYERPGQYLVRLTVTDSAGRVDTARTYLSIGGAPVCL